MTPEEKLLRAIFGEKASDVRDTSLRLPPGVSGTIVDVRTFNRHGIEIDDRTRAIQNEEIERLAKDREDERAILNRATFNRLKDMLLGQVATAAPKGIKKGVEIDEQLLADVERHEWWKFAVADDARQQQLEATKGQYDTAIKAIQEKFEDRKEKLERGDELAPGVLKMVKVFVAVKRKLQPGDKMAGRHGNKGIISRILPQEDMPFLEDGTPVDFVLNPLGVPSRMNVGQIFETHLGWAARGWATRSVRRSMPGAKPTRTRKRASRRSGARTAGRYLWRKLRRRDRGPQRCRDRRTGPERAQGRADGLAGVRRRRGSRCHRDAAQGRAG
jgi:DNA-directed RNA polymerase subunit beta